MAKLVSYVMHWVCVGVCTVHVLDSCFTESLNTDALIMARAGDGYVSEALGEGERQ